MRGALDRIVQEHGELKRVVNSFLQLLDGFKSEALTIAATNHHGLLDSALWRRFDEIVLFERPDGAAIESAKADFNLERYTCLALKCGHDMRNPPARVWRNGNAVVMCTRLRSFHLEDMG